MKFNPPDYFGVGGTRVFRVIARPNVKLENEIFEEVVRDQQGRDETLEQARRRVEGGYHDVMAPWIAIIYVKAEYADEAEEKAKKYWKKHGYTIGKKFEKDYEFYSSLANKKFKGDIYMIKQHSREFMDEMHRIY